MSPVYYLLNIYPRRSLPLATTDLDTDKCMFESYRPVGHWAHVICLLPYGNSLIIWILLESLVLRHSYHIHHCWDAVIYLAVWSNMGHYVVYGDKFCVVITCARVSRMWVLFSKMMITSYHSGKFLAMAKIRCMLLSLKEHPWCRKNCFYAVQ